MSALPFSTHSIETFTIIASLAWWVYILIVLILFFGGLLLNYIVKKINETRLENRFLRLTNKAAATHGTQILRPIIAMDKSTVPTNNGISLVFNKEENLLEDKRRKDEPPNIEPMKELQVNVAIASSEAIEKPFDSGKDEDITESVFLGSIYKELFENRLLIQKSNSLSVTRRDSILSEIFNKMVWKKITESKSTPSVKMFCSRGSEEFLKDWIFDLVRNKSLEPTATSQPTDLPTCSVIHKPSISTRST